MRVTLKDPTVVVTPGVAVTVEVDVTNTLPAIDGLTARVVGPEGVTTTSEPAILPLFPDTTGRLTLRVSFPANLLAGPHPAEVQVLSAVQPDQPGIVALGVEVLAQPAVALTVVPPLRSGHHDARYTVMCDNLGNTDLEVALAASDPDRSVRAKFHPLLLPVAAGESASALLSVRARRHLLGGEVGHAIKILGSAGDVGIEVEAQARFRQTPLIPRGARTALVLGLIIAAWAGAFLFGLGKAFGSDPLTKAVPPSFYAASKVPAGSGAAAGNGLGLIVGTPGLNDLPAGAVPKSGVVEGVGGTISGTVLAASTGQGVGRITIEAKRDSPSGLVLVSSAASQADGSYSLVGLLPGMYKLHFTAGGFQDLWYPTAPGDATATPVDVAASSITAAMPATVVGLPGSISGMVDTGAATPPLVTVQVTPEQGTTSAVLGTVTTDSAGHYTISGLPTPGTYDLTFSAPHFQAGSDVEQLGGGEKRIANQVRLTAGGGEIDGLVTDGTNPLGGVTITANANGRTLTSATPTTGAIGHFALTGLSTPATYLLTFTKTGFGTKTVSVFLGPGEINNNLTVSMVGGTGQVTGLVSGPTTPGGATVPLGGVTVTVNGGAAPVTTQTLTAAPLGTYVVSGLVTPGNYTVTFSKGGYNSLTVPVTLASSGSATGVNATLSLGVGLIAGTVTHCTVAPCPPGAMAPLGGVSVTVSDGNPADTRTTITSDALGGSPPVSYSLSGLPAGAYSVSFSLAGYATQTLFVQLGPGQLVAPGQPVTANVTMAPSS